MSRVLLDEDVPVPLRAHFPPDHHVETVEFRGWKGVKNGQLLRLAAADFDVFVTLDSKLPDQQNISSLDLMVVVLRPRSKRLPDILQLMPQLASVLNEPISGQAIRITPIT
jgi:hypothetical protein